MRSSTLVRQAPAPVAFLTDTQLSARSGNSKTGPIPTTSRTEATCPSTCPFLPSGKTGGCYGTGRIFGMVRKGVATITESEAVAKLRAGCPIGARFLRDRVVGDLVKPDGSFDLDHLLTIARIAKKVGVIAFGYTHAWRLMSEDDVRHAAESGYVLNASCETETDVKAAVFLGLPAVITGNSWEEGQMIGGLRVVTCPAETREDVTCFDCGLCTKPDRKALVRFHTHGVARRKAANTADALRKADEAA